MLIEDPELRYKLTRQIARGTFGELWNSVDTLSGKEYAVKLESLENNSGQLQKEKKIYKYLLTRLDKNHLRPNIPIMYEFGHIISKNCLYLVMDLLEKSNKFITLIFHI